MTKTLTSLVWEDPPERTTYDWHSIADMLRAKPGEWAKIFDEDRSSLATAIRNHGINVLDPDLGFEVKTRNNNRLAEPRTCTLYLRYVPKKEHCASRCQTVLPH